MLTSEATETAKTETAQKIPNAAEKDKILIILLYHCTIISKQNNKMEEKDGFDNGAIAADVSENERILPVSEENGVRSRRKLIKII